MTPASREDDGGGGGGDDDDDDSDNKGIHHVRMTSHYDNADIMPPISAVSPKGRFGKELSGGLEAKDPRVWFIVVEERFLRADNDDREDKQMGVWCFIRSAAKDPR